MHTLQHKKVAILTDNGFEEVELTSPKAALEAAGAEVHIVSMQEKVKGWNHDHWSIELNTDVKLADAHAENYDALMIPGGVINPDTMRAEQSYINFAKAFLEVGKPVAAICHGPQLLIETGLLRGVNIPSYPSIKTDLVNAGANWIIEAVVTDHGLITSQSPQDLDAFNRKMIEEIREGIHVPQAVQTPLY